MMTLLSRTLRLLPAAALSALPFTAAANNYESVAAEIDVGGPMMVYMDFAGDADALANILQEVYIAYLAANPEQMPVPLNFNLLMDQLGLSGIQALGISSNEIEVGLFENKSFVLLDGPPAGLLSMYAADNKAFTIADEAPANADMVLEFTIDYNALVAMSQTIAGSIMGPMGSGMIDQQLMNEVMPGLTVQQIIDALSGPVKAVLTFREGVSGAAAPWMSTDENGMPTALGFDLKMEIEGAGGLITQLMPMLEGMGLALEEHGGGSYLNLGMFLAQAGMSEDILVKVSGAGEPLTLATKTALLEIPSQTLADSPAFQKDVAGLPTEGIAFSYISPRFTDLSYASLDALAETNPEIGPVLNALTSAFSRFSGSQSSVSVLKENGLYSIQRAPTSYKTQLAVTALIVPISFGVGAAQAEMAGEWEDEPMMPSDEEEPGQ